jgi:hypothetical protein
MSMYLEPILFFLTVLSLYVALPAAIVWGWVRWIRGPRKGTVSAAFSLIGFAFATMAGLLVIGAVVAGGPKGYQFYDPRLMRIFAVGIVLSLAGITFGMCGVWRGNPLRWLAPTCSLGMLAFWLLMAAME